jgi:peptidoglycan pentaglycine glycine transferase (the first glycine)
MKVAQWNQIIASFDKPHLLQTYQWGLLKSFTGWTPIHKIWQENGEIVAATLVLERQITLGSLPFQLKVLYVPKGPLLADWSDSKIRQRVYSELRDLALERGAIFIKIDPDVELASSPSSNSSQLNENSLGHAIAQELLASGWVYSKEQIQFRNTLLLELDSSEEDLIMHMKQKTRYNIHLAQRKGVKIRIGTSNDWNLLYRMFTETSVRDDFVIREQAYYQKAWGIFNLDVSKQNVEIETLSKEGIDISNKNDLFSIPEAESLIAEVDGMPVAGVVYYRFAHRAWYLYGMSFDRHREKMPNHLLQWTAISRAKQSGCRQIDFWGAPEEVDDSDPLNGIYRFKQGFGGRYVRYIGAWDLPVRPVAYNIYMKILPHILDIMRYFGKKRSKTRHDRD